MKFIVITGVPDMDDPEEAQGNLAAVFELYQVKGGYVERVNRLVCLGLLVPVFHVGELIVADNAGRELAYPRRKPSKWDVAYETYDRLEDAVERVLELT